MSRSLLASSLAVAAGLITSAAAAPVIDSPVVRTTSRDRVSADAALRVHRATAAIAPKAREGAWATFRARHGDWNGLWDRANGAPVRLWGAGIAAPGANASADRAAAAATALLTEHLALLAPGTRLEDFTLVTNQVHGGLRGAPMRTVAFAQHKDGAEVLGASIGFLFKNDRVFVINSTAVDARAVAVPAAPIAPGSASVKARAWIEAEVGAATTVVTTDATVRVLPLVYASGAVAARPVVSLDVATTDDARSGRWRVFVDATDGTLVARDSQVLYATGAVRYRVPDRSPQRPRVDAVVPFTSFRVGATTTPSNAAGQITWTGDAAAQVTTALTGDFARITNAAGTLATATLTVEPGGTAVWDRSTVATDDAQLTTYIAVLKVKDYVRANIDPTHSYLDQQISATVNENSTCNAQSTGDDIHFFRSSSRCENTGRIADVVYHEFGHSLHANSIIRGVGAFNGGLSEGVSDYLAATVTNDPGMGRGFFYTDNPLRNLDPSRDLRWPDDATGEVHDDGEIIAGTLWDVRKEMISIYGAAEGVSRADAIFYAVIQRASDIPTSYVEALAQDDDDGDLSNGTPNLCALRRVFGAHGLALGAGPVGSGVDLPEVTRGDDGAMSVAVTVGGAVGGCAAPTIGAANLTWRLRGGVNPNLVAMTRDGQRLTAVIPPAPDGSVIEWSLDIAIDATRVRYPDNAADPMYQVYVGAVETLYCTDFETDAGWTHGGSGGRDNWEQAAPVGAGGDPRAAASGTMVLGTALTDGVGSYQPDSNVWARSPVIDTSGFSTVRLQYKRWLNVEDGFFDKAKISADGAQVWTNLNSNNGDSSSTHHRDREWRFHDVDLTAQAADGSVQLEFSLTSDAGLEFGGWNLDDVCVVGLRSPPGACGNNMLDGTEQCDDGNTASGDGCSATCAIEDDTGGTEDGGCCSTGQGPGGSLIALGLGAAVALLRRRRR